jgi:hypothetical protein
MQLLIAACNQIGTLDIESDEHCAEPLIKVGRFQITCKCLGKRL